MPSKDILETLQKKADQQKAEAAEKEEKNDINNDTNNTKDISSNNNINIITDNNVLPSTDVTSIIIDDTFTNVNVNNDVNIVDDVIIGNAVDAHGDNVIDVVDNVSNDTVVSTNIVKTVSDDVCTNTNVTEGNNANEGRLFIKIIEEAEKVDRYTYYLKPSTDLKIEEKAKKANMGKSAFLQKVLDMVLDIVEIG